MITKAPKIVGIVERMRRSRYRQIFMGAVVSLEKP
jgi:hypothetical protein